MSRHGLLKNILSCKTVWKRVLSNNCVTVKLLESQKLEQGAFLSFVFVNIHASEVVGEVLGDMAAVTEIGVVEVEERRRTLQCGKLVDEKNGRGLA